ncbi:MAG: acetyltransferase [Solobacterium sp.]|nr:acetyltransferase [Solobacterium sp.]
MKQMFLYGVGGIGCELADYFSEKEYDIVFIDDNEAITEMYGFPVYTFEKAVNMFPLKEAGVTVTIGEPVIRERLTNRLKEYEIPEKTLDVGLYHSKRTVVIGDGSIIHFGSILTVRTTLGHSCLINKGAVIGHDCTIGDHCVLSPNVTVGGSVVIGNGTFVGSGAVIRNNIEIGQNVIIGMGAVITKSVRDNAVVVGNPGKEIRENTSRRVFGN